MELKTFRIGGVHPEENKLTSDKVTQIAALPKQAIFPLSQHIGAPAKPVVQKGDKVKVGTMIAEAGGFVSAPIYSSVSGTVFKIDEAIDATGYRKPSIIINVEGDEWEESIDRSDKLEKLADHRINKDNSRCIKYMFYLLERKTLGTDHVSICKDTDPVCSAGHRLINIPEKRNRSFLTTIFNTFLHRVFQGTILIIECSAFT